MQLFTSNFGSPHRRTCSTTWILILGTCKSLPCCPRDISAISLGRGIDYLLIAYLPILTQLGRDIRYFPSLVSSYVAPLPLLLPSAPRPNPASGPVYCQITWSMSVPSTSCHSMPLLDIYGSRGSLTMLLQNVRDASLSISNLSFTRARARPFQYRLRPTYQGPTSIRQGTEYSFRDEELSHHPLLPRRQQFSLDRRQELARRILYSVLLHPCQRQTNQPSS